jgi:GTP-binding protein
MIRIVDSVFIKSAVKPADYPSSEYNDIAFVGKSNVGKSSMINTLLGRKMIAKVSSSPGKTKLINFFKVRFKNQNGEDGFMNFVDLPGYGYAKVSFAEREKWKKIINTYLSEREGLKGIIMLVDIRHNADKKDVMMADYLKSYRIPYLIVATKSDKIKKTLIGKTIKKLSAEFGVTSQEILPFSSLKKNGMEDVLKWIETKIL